MLQNLKRELGSIVFGLNGTHLHWFVSGPRRPCSGVRGEKNRIHVDWSCIVNFLCNVHLGVGHLARVSHLVVQEIFWMLHLGPPPFPTCIASVQHWGSNNWEQHASWMDVLLGSTPQTPCQTPARQDIALQLPSALLLVLLAAAKECDTSDTSSPYVVSTAVNDGAGAYSGHQCLEILDTDTQDNTVKEVVYLVKDTTTTITNGTSRADPGGPGGPASPCPKIFSKSCSF